MPFADKKLRKILCRKKR